MLRWLPRGIPRAVALPANQIFHTVPTQPLRRDSLHFELLAVSLRTKDRGAAMWRGTLMALESRNMVHVVNPAKVRWELQAEADGRHL